MKTLTLGLLVAFLSGCASGISRNGTGLIYTDVKDSINATSNNEHGSKKGTSCATNILGMVSRGDMSIDSAKKNGGITKVASVDYTQESILGVWGKTCAEVTGD